MSVDVLQSVIRVVFHERRLQYMEREQLDIWRQTRPGERIIEIGLISYDVSCDTGLFCYMLLRR